MSKIIRRALIVILISEIIVFGTQMMSVSRETEIKEVPEATPTITEPLTELQQWKEHLKNQLLRTGKTDRDILIMDAIVFCESSWGQYYKNGEVKVSKGNIGLAQINGSVHKEEYTKLGLDPFDPIDNLTYAVILYNRNGVRDWATWSGHCWKPILAKKGIIINEKL